MVVSKALRNISRIDFKTANGDRASGGWEVRIQRRGKRVEKFFADRALGGRRKALEEAKSFRDEQLAKLRRYSIKELAKRPSRRNRSGLVGVRRSTQSEVRGDWRYDYVFWVAQWTDANGRRCTRSFAVSRYGEDGAFQRAVAARNRGIAARSR
jgi:AP2 domain